MAGASPVEKEISAIPTNSIQKTALEEFKDGLVRSMKQHNSGLEETFDNVDDFLAELHNSE
ncbi:MAG: hypothetical protein M0Q13_03410 [Methanothrix sp.]|jgi:hypothetical protein|nr:hypothetical protein [Methanothrix sp.]